MCVCVLNVPQALSVASRACQRQCHNYHSYEPVNLCKQQSVSISFHLVHSPPCIMHASKKPPGFSPLKHIRIQRAEKVNRLTDMRGKPVARYDACLQMSAADRSDNISYDSLSVCRSLVHLAMLLPALKRSPVDTPRLKLVVMAPTCPNQHPIKTSKRVSLIELLSRCTFFCTERVRLLLRCSFMRL